MTFNFFNKPFNITKLPELSGGSFTFNWKSLTAISALIKEWLGYPIQTAYSLAGDLINWKLWGNSKQSILPSGYTQLEYIQNNTNYAETRIETGVLWASITKAIINLSEPITVTSTAGNIMLTSFKTTTQANTPYLGVTRDLSQITSAGITVDGTQSSWNGTKLVCTFTSSSSNQIAISGWQDSTWTSQYKYKSVEFYNGNTLVRNFIPAKNISNVVGMYDLVTNTFFTNAGTGTFIGGTVTNPTPSAPIEIQGVGDKTANLCNNNRTSWDLLYSGRSGIALDLSKKYTIKVRIKEGKSAISGCYVGFGGIRTGESSWSAETWVVNNGSFTNNGYTKSQDRSYSSAFGVNFYGVTPAQFFDVYEVMLCEDWKEENEMAYIPYGYQIPVSVVGANLLDSSKFKSGWLSTTSPEPVLSDYITGGTTGGSSIALPLSVQQNDIVTVKYYTSTTLPSIGYAIYRGGTQVYRNGAVTLTNNAYTITVPQTGNLYVWNGGATGTSESIVNKVLIVKGSTAPEVYVPYSKSIKTTYLSNPLHKVSTFVDYIDYESQQVVRANNTITFTGASSETWRSTSTNIFVIDITNRKEDLITDVYCDRFTKVSAYGTMLSTDNSFYGGSYTTGQTTASIFIHYSACSTIAEFKTWLASNPVTVVYPQAVPTTESVTVPALTMSEGTNNITSITELTPSDMYAQGYVSYIEIQPHVNPSTSTLITNGNISSTILTTNGNVSGDTLTV